MSRARLVQDDPQGVVAAEDSQTAVGVPHGEDGALVARALQQIELAPALCEVLAQPPVVEISLGVESVSRALPELLGRQLPRARAAHAMVHREETA
eukprot:370255-Pyramimonas_sp.AAC.1